MQTVLAVGFILEKNVESREALFLTNETVCMSLKKKDQVFFIFVS